MQPRAVGRRPSRRTPVATVLRARTDERSPLTPGEGELVLRFGTAVVDPSGRPLGKLATIGLDATGRLTAVETEEAVYPGAGLRPDIGGGDAVGVDPDVHVIVKVDRELRPGTRAWTVDSVEFQVQALVVDAVSRVGRRLVLRRRRRLVDVPFALARVERDGVVLAAAAAQLEGRP
jgi:hypothetical protein